MGVAVDKGAVICASSELSLEDAWGSVPRSVYSLFKSITNGTSWELVAEPLGDVHGIWLALFLLYIAFAYFAVLNVVTGVFCQMVCR